MALVAVIVVLGALVWYLGPFRSDNPGDNTPRTRPRRSADATAKVNQVLAPGDMIHNDPAQAQTLLQGAWDDLQAAKAGRQRHSVQPGAARVTGALEALSARHG